MAHFKVANPLKIWELFSLLKCGSFFYIKYILYRG